MPFFSKDKDKKDSGDLPAAINLGMHISGGETARPVYFILRSLIAAAGIFGTVFCFITACVGYTFFQYSVPHVTAAIIIGWAYFSAVFAIYERSPELSRSLSSGGIILIMIYGIIRVRYIAAGLMNSVNIFMATLYSKYREVPLFAVPETFVSTDGGAVDIDYCSNEAFIFLVLMICIVVCRGTVKKPNILLVLGATFPLAELCLYFGLVPNYAAYALLLCSWAGALAAEITEFGAFEDKSARGIFSKTGAQSAFAAALIMLLSFMGAFVYAVPFARPASADNFRIGFMYYMKDFSWKKLTEDLRDAFVPAKNKTVTHDGKLGNVESVEFSGKNMLDVTLPADSETVYLKGFIGTQYTGSRWNEGPAMPALTTRLTSPEFFSGRTLKYVPGFDDLYSKDVIVRNTGIDPSMRYFPVNAAGMTAAEGGRRTYGVYFPKDEDWRRQVIEDARSISLPDELAEDELRLRAYAQSYCLEVPATFTAAEDFFADYEGVSLYDELNFIKSKLAEECEYDLDAGKKPFGVDFAQWFLTDNKKGSCTHFATAAALLCRSRGIPARYCEGFVIKSEDIDDYTPQKGYVTVSVPDTRAHAWAEIYVDGYGWLSFETTPGYGNVSLDYLPSSDSEVSSVITSVVTEPPMFSDSITDRTTVTFTDTRNEEQTEEDEGVTETETSISETTAPTEESYEESGSGGFEYDPSGETGEADSSGAAAGMGGAGSGNAETAVPDENVAPGGNAAPDGAGGSDPEPYPQPGSIPQDGNGGENSSEPDPETKTDKRDNSAVIRVILHILAVVGIIGGVVGAVVLRRVIILALRRSRIEKSPEKAAAEMYRMLMKLARDAEIDLNVPADELPARLGESEYFDGELCAAIINTALRARFGGGITAQDAEKSAHAYAKIAAAVNERSKAGRLISVIVYCSDRYI